MNKNAGSADVWLWLTVPTAILLAIAAGCGIFIDGLYRDTPGLVAQAIGQDAITLMIALPALLIGAYLTSRGSHRGRLIWLGGLVYVVYTYASYAFGIRFNPLFLIYIALLGCSTYALIGGLVTTDWAGIRAGFTERTPVRAVSIFLVVIAALFYLIWLSEALPASLTGIPPQSVKEDGTPTNVVHVLDMAWLLPALVIAAVSLWRKTPVGYALAAALLANLVFLTLAVLAMLVFQARGGEPVGIPQVVIFTALFAVSIAMLTWHLRGLKSIPAPK
ncbi:MAG TPA: hypothetical protein VK897_25580 [Anaerolineales bacterium]|nr:hypothetical protein [Anaerolineales bacterium]